MSWDLNKGSIPYIIIIIIYNGSSWYRELAAPHIRSHIRKERSRRHLFVPSPMWLFNFQKNVIFLFLNPGNHNKLISKLFFKMYASHRVIRRNQRSRVTLRTSLLKAYNIEIFKKITPSELHILSLYIQIIIKIEQDVTDFTNLI